jgi:death-on-curing protein
MPVAKYLTVEEVIRIHEGVLRASGGSAGLRDRGALESAVAQPQATFGGEDLYPTLPEKAAALAFGIVNNHPFVDGNKRTGTIAMQALLFRNGRELDAGVDGQEQVILDVAAGRMTRDELADWIEAHVVARGA